VTAQQWHVMNVIDKDTLTIWDGQTKERWGEAAGTMTLTVPDHGAVGGEVVNLIVQIQPHKEGA